jgi:hypothetical protein
MAKKGGSDPCATIGVHRFLDGGAGQKAGSLPPLHRPCCPSLCRPARRRCSGRDNAGVGLGDRLELRRSPRLYTLAAQSANVDACGEVARDARLAGWRCGFRALADEGLQPARPSIRERGDFLRRSMKERLAQERPLEPGAVQIAERRLGKAVPLSGVLRDPVRTARLPSRHRDPGPSPARLRLAAFARRPNIQPHRVWALR